MDLSRGGKRLREAGHDAEDYVRGFDEPSKIAWISDLKALHPDLQ